VRKTSSKARLNVVSRSWISSSKRRHCPRNCMTRFRACCVTQALSGLAVQAIDSSRRVASEMKKSTSIRCGASVSTVKTSPASALAALLTQERPPRLSCPLGSGRNASDAQHRAHRGRRDRKPEPRELAGDPLISPNAGSRAPVEGSRPATAEQAAAVP
jgi:hypothetical protein